MLRKRSKADRGELLVEYVLISAIVVAGIAGAIKLLQRQFISNSLYMSECVAKGKKARVQVVDTDLYLRGHKDMSDFYR